MVCKICGKDADFLIEDDLAESPRYFKCDERILVLKENNNTKVKQKREEKMRQKETNVKEVIKRDVKQKEKNPESNRDNIIKLKPMAFLYLEEFYCLRCHSSLENNIESFGEKTLTRTAQRNYLLVQKYKRCKTCGMTYQIMELQENQMIYLP